MAQLKDLLVSGPSRLIGKLFANEVQLTTLDIPTANGSTTYGPGTAGYYLRTNGSSVYWDAMDAGDIPGIDASKITSGTLPVSRGGTGVASISSGQVMIGNGTNAITTRAILNNTAAGALGWNSAGASNADNLRLVDVNTIAYWNGAYSGTSSNLKILGTVTTGTWNASTIGVGYGGTGKTSWTKYGVLYADATNSLTNTAVGTAGHLLMSNGGTSAPSWKDPGTLDVNTAKTLKTARNISVGAKTNSFNGSADISFPTADMGIIWSDINPIKSKTYENVTVTGNSDPAGWLYFFKAPSSGVYQDIWHLTYRVIAKCAGQADSHQVSIVHIDGVRNTYTSYWVWNSIGNTSYRPIYGHAAYFCSTSGPNAYAPILGLRFQSALDPTNATYARTITFEILEEENCSVTFFNAGTLYSAVEGTGSTYFNTSRVAFDGTTQGITTSGDRNSTTISTLYKQYGGYVAGNNIKRYQLVFQQLPPNDEYLITFFETDNAYGTTNKTLLTTEFDPLGHIYYYNSTGTNNTNTNIDPGRLYYACLSDLRYSFNVTNTSNNDLSATFTGIAYRPVYLRVVINATTGGASIDGNQPLTMTLPTTNDGKYYIYLGQVYDWYRFMLDNPDSHPVFYHDGKQIVRYYGKNIGGSAARVTDSNDRSKDINITYSKAGQASTSWLASWNGYELGAISPGNITAGKATKANLTTTANAVAYFTDTAGTFGSKASANGALYATSANGALQWGTLPVAQGGTGQTTSAGIFNVVRDNGGDGRWVKKAGDTITGNINRYYGSASTDPMFSALANNLDIYLWEVGHGTAAAATTTSNHYKLLYKGTGSSPNNYLQLIAHNSSDKIAYQIDENGLVTFPQSSGFTYSGIGAASDNTERVVWFAYNGVNGRPVYDNDFKYNPAINQLHLVHASGKSGEYRVTYSTTVDMWLGVGSGDENHGLYDAKKGDWMIYANASGAVTLNGNATTATKLSNTPNTTTTYLRGDNSWQTLISSGTSTLAWNSEITLATVGGVAIKAKLPANPNTNTDTLVKQTASTSNGNYKILATASTSPTSGNAAEAIYDTSVTINPSTHNINAESYNDSIKMSKVQAWGKTGPYDAGWKRVCALTGYNGYGVGTVYINGSWSSEEPTLAILEISFSNTNYAHIKQIIGARKTTPDQVRLVYSGTGGKWYFDIHIPARTASSATGVRYVTFVGKLTVSEKDETTNLLTSEPTTTTVVRDLIVTNDQPTITVDLDSTTAGAFTGANMTTGISGTLAVGHGGTGATTAANARTNLGLGSMAVETATNYLKWQTTTAESTALYDFGVYVNQNHAAGTGMTGGNYFQIINIPYRKASGNTKADWGFQIGNTTANDGRLWYRTSGDNVWGDWQTIAHATQSTSNTGSATQPVYMTAAGVITAGTALKDLAYIAKPTSSTTAVFLRGDGNWSNEISGGILKVTNHSNTFSIGSQNTSFNHLYNSANIPFIFNNSVLTTTGNLGNSTYPFNNLYIGKAGAKGIYYVGTKSTNQMITFVDNTSDTYGNGIKIGGGGVTVIGAGESTANLSVTGGSEVLYLLSDEAINIEAGGGTIANRVGVQVTTAGHLLPVKAEAANDLVQNIGSITQRWKEIHGNVLMLSGPASDPSSSAGARIRFSYDNSSDHTAQPVYISYTPNDSYRSPAGLKVFGGTSATPVWFEVEGSYYATGTSTGQSYYINSSNVNYGRLYIDTKGVAGTATTYTNPDDSTQTKTGYTGNVTGKSILVLGNNKAVGSNGSSYSSPGSAGNADNAQGYLRVYSSGTTYGELSGYGSYIYPTNGIAFPENKVALNFRPGSSSYYVHVSHQTNGNEATVFATQNAVTSFIFVNGEGIANVGSNRWTNLTGASGAGNAPGLQIKNNCVSIGKLIPSGTTPTYKLEVNGTGYFADNITANKAIYFGNNTGTAGGCVLGFNSSYPKYGIWYFDDSTDVMTFSASGNADSKTGADLAINVHGAGTVAIRNNRVPHTGNTTGTVGSTTQPVYVDAGQIKAITGNIANSTTGNAATATKCGTSAIWWYPENNNELNIGGTNTSTTLYIGYRAKDSRGIPTKIIFGGSGGSTRLKFSAMEVNTTSYGTALPTSGQQTGQVFFQLSDVQYELPAGGTADQVLTKNSAADRDVKWATLNAGTVTMTANNSTKYYVAGSTSTTTATLSPIFNTSVYVENSKLYGAAWNDYAEYRETEIEIEPGRVVIENGDDTLSLSTERMQPGAEIVTDTYGFAIGKTKTANTPIATTGRVLAYPAEDRKSYKPGQPVCSGPNGTVSMMTNEEARTYPWLIIGTVSAIPDYDTWNDIKVNGRIWIRIR